MTEKTNPARTIYVPRTIASAAEAEALPIGTVTVHYPRSGMEDQAGVRVRGGWEFTGTIPDVFDHREAIGMEALVPVEAEEQWAETNEFSGVDRVSNEGIAWEQSADNGRRPSRRYVSAWEEVR
ncbi:hypothetical protein ACXET9_07195 [Brachybacterium sp. DNPG3]